MLVISISQTRTSVGMQRLRRQTTTAQNIAVPQQRLLTREETKELCETILDSLKLRRLAIYPPNEKRKLPDDIPTQKDFRKMREDIKNVRTSLLTAAGAGPRKRVANLIRVTQKAAIFLRLPAIFNRYYTRDLLVKVICLYVVINKIETATDITIDRRLSEVTGEKVGTVVPRSGIFGLVSRMVEPVTEEAKAAAASSSVREVVPPTSLDAILADRADLTRLTEILHKLRHAYKQVYTIDNSPSKDLLQKEYLRWQEYTQEYEAALQATAQSIRIFTSAEKTVVEDNTEAESEKEIE